MPFNKGDFTQQGVAGHVNANLRLNEKRLVNIDLTSNEETEGCTITGTVKDLLNDKVYNIGSGGGGGGGDLPVGKCTITIVNSAESQVPLDFTDSATPVYLIGGYTAIDNKLILGDDYLSESRPDIAAGESLTTEVYYSFDAGSIPGVEYILGPKITYTVSNIENMTFRSYTEEGATINRYTTTDLTVDSSITLTVLRSI